MSASEAQHPTKRRIIDAHHHFWDPSRNYHPWLCDPEPIPFRYGDYSALRKPYLIQDYRRDTQHYQVDGSVYIETEWDPKDFAGETLYVAALRQEGLPSVAIMAAHLDDPTIDALLAHHASFPFVRGIRHKPRSHPTPGNSAPGGMMDSAWRRGYARLEHHNLGFELQTPWWHMHEAVTLVKEYPNTPIIINHAGLPADRSAEGLAAWAKAMAAIAACDGVAIKISGIGQKDQPWTADANRSIVLTLIDLFGVERCMFASNFPVDSLCGSFDDIFSGFEAIVADFSTVEQDALFRANAARFYRIDTE